MGGEKGNHACHQKDHRRHRHLWKETNDLQASCALLPCEFFQTLQVLGIEHRLRSGVQGIAGDLDGHTEIGQTFTEFVVGFQIGQQLGLRCLAEFIEDHDGQ